MRFNNFLATVVVVLILGLWGAQGAGLVDLPDIVIGATISILTLVIQFYFRKAPNGN